jgi:uncharacterized membrane protein YgdD (TMEM256/DUF423 family)
MLKQSLKGAMLAAGLFGALGVALGAYSAHGLENFLLKQNLEVAVVAKKLEQCDIAVRYHLLHAVALLALGSFRCRGRLLNSAAIFWTLGICLFCGGLYSMVFLNRMGHPAIIPLGGVCFLIGWLFIAMTSLRNTDCIP